MQTETVTSRTVVPPEVSRAVLLIVVSLLLGAIKTIVDWKHLSSVNGPSFTVSVLLLTFAVNGLLLWKIYQGRNWARLTFLTLFLLGLIPWIFIVGAEFHRSTVLAFASNIQAAIQVYAMALVFTSPAKEWFRPKHLRNRCREIGLSLTIPFWDYALSIHFIGSICSAMAAE
jgi:hypothetical protein